MKHAPGPWEIGRLKPKGFDFSVISPRGDAEMGTWLVAGVRWEANARLIAAAPDLLEACKGMVASLNGSPLQTMGMLKAHRALDAAIAKAEESQ